MATDRDGLGTLVERMYQDELAQYARERNTILAADTGTGKTLVAALVIRWKLAEDRKLDGPRKVVMFLVPKVPLVEQQRRVMEENLAETVKGYTGAMGVDFWDRTAWQKEFNEADILVMTPQIFLNILRHAHWTMNQVSMIVFDEVHNCKGRSPEAQIMNDHYHPLQPASLRPKILGLTASPIFNHKNPISALQQIEKLTDCKVIVVKQNTNELSKFTFQATDRIVDYRPSPKVWPLYETSETPSLWAELHSKRLLPNDLLFPKRRDKKYLPESEWYRAFAERYKSTIQALGPFAADIFAFVHISTHLEGLKSDLAPLYPDRVDTDAERRQCMEKINKVLDHHRPRLASEGEELRHEWLSPKLLVLKDLLLEQKDTPDFRGIIFCYERQFATTLALLLPRLGIPGIQAGPLVGHGQNACSEPTKIGMRGMAFRAQEHIVDDFRRGKLNFLIATSVAEEGLDFPLCSFVCRFDPPRTLPQYIQSRGRARKEGSTFIILLEQGPSLDRGRLEALQLSEHRLKKMYGRNMDKLDEEDDNSGDYNGDDDTFEGRFTVEKTGASITPGGCIALLEILCSLIPVDLHTRPLRPRYTIRSVSPLHDFKCEVLLPAALPIPRDQLFIRSDPLARSKKAAKRSAAFNAVRSLYHLGVFDDYLLPLRREKGDVAEDIDGKPPIDVTDIEPMMNVLVRDLWGDMRHENSEIFVHRLNVSGKGGMGLVCATKLSEYKGKMMATRTEKDVHISTGVPMDILDEERLKIVNLMEEYTRRGIRYSVTRKGLQKNLSFFLVPLDSTGNPDIDELEHYACTPASRDWRAVDVSGATDVLVSVLNDTKVSKLVRARPDIKLADCIAASTFLTKFVNNMRKYGVDVPENDLILECREILQTTSTEFRDPERQKAGVMSKETILLPQFICQWVNFHPDFMSWFMLLPPLVNLLQSVYRARRLQQILDVPLSLDRTIEALTLPSAGSSFSNQRLETLGDAFLKLATSIHVFKKFPYKHEGQLTVLKENSVSNRYLLGRGSVQNLHTYMNIEPNTQTRWRVTTEATELIGGEWFVERRIPRRSVQDCMEALLGVGWLSGGVQGALAVGTKLDLCFGGFDIWSDRYPSDMEICAGSPCPKLEEALGYQFKNKELLIEALTHPSFAKGGPCYQRLEFLGDAVLDIIILDHFFDKYPKVGPGKLSRARARCVCSPTLAAIATKKLEIHKHIFCDSVSLVQDMNNTARNVFDTMLYADIIDSIWKLEAPKALSDVVEALLGAILIDSGWSYDIVCAVVLHLFDEVLEVVHPNMPADPASEFMLWVGRYGCTQVKYKRCPSSAEIAPRKDLVLVIVHDVEVGPPTKIEPKKSAVIARAQAAIQARDLMSDPESPFAFEKLCTCTKKEKVENTRLYKAAVDLVADPADLDPETTEGFAIDAQSQLAKMGETSGEEVREDENDVDAEEAADDPIVDRTLQYLM